MVIGYKKRICDFEGCQSLTRNKGSYKGRTRYDRWCEFHHALKFNRTAYFEKYNKERRRICNDKCEVCGWDKAPCDRHRINPRKGYTDRNVKVLCPNCHRLESLRILRSVMKK